MLLYIKISSIDGSSITPPQTDSGMRGQKRTKRGGGVMKGGPEREKRNLLETVVKSFSFCEESHNDRTSRLTKPSEGKWALLLTPTSHWLDSHGSRRVTQISVQRLKSEWFFAPEPKNEKAKALELPLLQILEDVLGSLKRSRDSKREKIARKLVSA